VGDMLGVTSPAPCVAAVPLVRLCEDVFPAVLGSRFMAEDATSVWGVGFSTMVLAPALPCVWGV